RSGATRSRAVPLPNRRTLSSRPYGAAVAHRCGATRPHGDVIHTPWLLNSSGDLWAVPAHERARRIVGEVDPGGDGDGGVLEGYDVALAGAEARGVEVEDAVAEHVGESRMPSSAGKKKKHKLRQ